MGTVLFLHVSHYLLDTLFYVCHRILACVHAVTRMVGGCKLCVSQGCMLCLCVMMYSFHFLQELLVAGV